MTIKVQDINLELEDLDKKYNSFIFNYKEKENDDKFINIYKENFSKVYLNGENILDEKPIRELIKIKSEIIKKEDFNYYRYMDLQEKEYNDKKVLPEVLNYGNEIKKKTVNKNNKRKKHKNSKDSRKPTKNTRNNSFGNKIDLSNWNNK